MRDYLLFYRRFHHHCHDLRWPLSGLGHERFQGLGHERLGGETVKYEGKGVSHRMLLSHTNVCVCLIDGSNILAGYFSRFESPFDPKVFSYFNSY